MSYHLFFNIINYMNASIYDYDYVCYTWKTDKIVPFIIISVFTFEHLFWLIGHSTFWNVRVSFMRFIVFSLYGV